MIQIQRVIWSDNGTLKDISVNMNDWKQGTQVLPFESANDWLYMGSDFAFNHRHIEVKVANDQACSVEVELWDGKNWQPAIDIIDTTSVSGVSLAKSGRIQWSPDPRESNWTADDTNDSGQTITGLSGVKIYGMYWVRIRWTANLNALTELNSIGWKFSTDRDLETYYPSLLRPDMMKMFKSGKTDWNEQHLEAASEVIRDLKRKQSLFSGNQILEPALFVNASVHKVAEMAFRGFGNDFLDLLSSARDDYEKQLDSVFLYLDQNNDATLNKQERTNRTGWLYR